MSFKEGDKLFIFSDSAFRSDTNAYRFYIKNYAVSEGVTETAFLNKENISLSENLMYRHLRRGDLFFWNDKLIYEGGYFPTHAAIDYLLINTLRYPKMKSLDANKNTTFLLSGEMKTKTKERWLKLIADNNLDRHDLLTEGAILLP